jgi:GntR family transcriptional regulator, transcriptional repressor for pyruvate dehydrogenase complex
MPAFAPVKRLKIAEQVAGTLRDAILGGDFNPGDTLPSERDLASEFAVNRSSVREAIHRLEAWGLVEVRQGGGTRVRDFLTSAGMQLLPWLLAPGGALDPKMLMDLLELRVALLGWTASRAAERRQDGSVDALKACLDRLESATSPGELGAADWDFFEAQVAMSDNSVLALLSNVMRQVYEQNRGLFEMIYAAPSFDLTAHRRAFAAIEGAEPSAAAAAMEAYGRSVLPGGAS